jgi:biopolymer transport protein ExbB
MVLRPYAYSFLSILLLPVAGMADESSLPVVSLPRDLSPVGMFLDADWVVKAVMLGLLFASVLTWTIWLVKTFELRILRRQLRDALAACEKAPHLDVTGATRLAPSISVFLRQAEEELSQSGEASAAGIKERVESRLAELESGAHQDLIRGTGVLASIGATAPFVGLFGTVWGIMNSFIGISHANTTNLAVVAPGIAESLLATAMGLVAAIPAVVLYNYLARQIGDYRASLRQLSMRVLRLVSRDLDIRDLEGCCLEKNHRKEIANGHEAA